LRRRFNVGLAHLDRSTRCQYPTFISSFFFFITISIFDIFDIFSITLFFFAIFYFLPSSDADAAADADETQRAW
jgi:hypothetical protein